MTTNPALLLANWFSPGRAARAFTFSNRLPWAIRSGQLSNADDVALWAQTILEDGAGFHDALYLSSAYEARAEAEIAKLNELYDSYCDSVNRTSETQELGSIFARLIKRTADFDVSQLGYPIAVGQAAARTSLPLEMTLRFFLESYTTRLVSAACKQLNIPETKGQKIVRDLAPTIDSVLRKSINLATKDSVPVAGYIAALRTHNVNTPTHA